MLHKVSKIRGTAVRATDGEIGNVEEFYFDDNHWTIRYLSVDTGPWLPRRIVLSSRSVGKNWSMAGLTVRLTRKQVENSPHVDSGKAFSRQDEEKVLAYYEHAPYWQSGAVSSAKVASAGKASEQHLYSTKEVTGHHVQASDGEIGHVDDFLIDEETWRIRYLVVDTSNFIGGKSVLISPTALVSIDWSNGKMHVPLTRHAVKQSPSLDSVTLATGEDIPFILM